jgi:hypothetical protein
MHMHMHMHMHTHMHVHMHMHVPHTYLFFANGGFFLKIKYNFKVRL